MTSASVTRSSTPSYRPQITTSRSSRLSSSATAWVNGRPCGVISTTADAAPALGRDRLDAREQRLGLHHHPRPAAVRHVVDRPVPIVGVVAQVAHPHIDHPPLARPPHHAGRQRRLDQFGKDRDDVGNHRRRRPVQLDQPRRADRSRSPFADGSIRRQIASVNGTSTLAVARHHEHRHAGRQIHALDRADVLAATVRTAHPTRSWT